MRKKIGIVGFGEMGKRHGLEFREATKGFIELAGVVEPSDRMYSEGCEWNQLEIPRFASISEMLDRSALDGAVIASPNHKHLGNLKEFAGHTIPILIEKPLDSCLDTVSEVVRFARGYRGHILVDHVMRYAPIIQRARALVEEGKLGRISSFQFSQRSEIEPFHTFRRSKSGGGGQMIEKATHDLDVMLFLCGSTPVRVGMISKQHHIGGEKDVDLRCSHCDERLVCPSSSEDRGNCGSKDINLNNDLCVYAKNVDISDNEACLIELENGVFGTYSHTYFCRMVGQSRVYDLIGTEGAISMRLIAEVPGHFSGVLDFYPRSKAGEVETYRFDYFGKIHYNGGAYIARHFYELMCSNEVVPFTTVNQAFVAETLGFAAMQSAAENQFVSVSSVVPEDLLSIYRGTYPASVK